MTGHYLLSELRALGFRVWASGGALFVMPRAKLTRSDDALIREHKPALLAALADEEPWPDPPDGLRCPGCERCRPAARGRQRKGVS